MYKRVVKRLLDIIASVIFLPFFGITFLIFAPLIKLEDRGPVFYKTERIGKNSKSFKMYKYRSMKINAPLILNEDGSTYNSQEDFRVTKTGKFMRETSVDELPQILNVLRGEMSIIGPRASLMSVLHTFKEDEVAKMDVKPGITGFTQAYYRNNISNREKRLKDARYAKNISFILDIKILIKTVFTIVKKEGLYTEKREKEFS